MKIILYALHIAGVQALAWLSVRVAADGVGNAMPLTAAVMIWIIALAGKALIDDWDF